MGLDNLVWVSSREIELAKGRLMRGGRGPVQDPKDLPDMSRQWETSPELVRMYSGHHYYRYEFAVQYAFGRVLDAACGCGYGSSMLFEKTEDVTGVDYDLEAINWARQYFSDTFFIHSKIEELPDIGEFDTVVSLETIEHMPDPSPSLRRLRKLCRGTFIASVPNEELYHFDPEVFKNDNSPHFRHYTPKEFDELLHDHHFRVRERYCQVSKQFPEVVEGTQGKFLIYVCD